MKDTTVPHFRSNPYANKSARPRWGPRHVATPHRYLLCRFTISPDRETGAYYCPPSRSRFPYPTTIKPRLPRSALRSYHFAGLSSSQNVRCTMLIVNLFFSCLVRYKDLFFDNIPPFSFRKHAHAERILRIMEAGGNRRFGEFTRRIGHYPWSTVEDKYSHPCLPLYRKHIVAVADGEEPPPISREAIEKASSLTPRNVVVACLE